MNIEIEARRVSLGVRRVPVFWVFRDYRSKWQVRREGQEFDIAYSSRTQALEAARHAGSVFRTYRLYLELEDGRFMTEVTNNHSGHNRGPNHPHDARA